MKKLLLSCGLLTFLFVCPALGQGTNWESVKTLSRENILVVKTVQGKTLRGFFQSADEGKMSLLNGSRTVEINRSEVRQVYLGKKKKSIIGGFLGAGAGYLATLLVFTAVSPDGEGSYAAGAAGLGAMVGGGILGQRIGAKVKRGYLVYQAP